MWDRCCLAVLLQSGASLTTRLVAHRLLRSGWGYGWRTYVALAMLCIPVVIQPLVEQAYHELLPYPELVLTYDPVDIPRLPELLRAVDAQTVCRMRRAALRYRRLLIWDGPQGLAYEGLLLLLCHRAAALHTQAGRPPQPWMACSGTTAAHLLDNA
eukprot:802233-Prymnesium_polylepis.4